MSNSPEQLMAALQSRLYRTEQERDEALTRYAEREGRWGWALIREGNAIRDAGRAQARLIELEAAVLALHRPDGGVAGPGAMCVECTFNFGTPHEEPVAYPCATVRLVSDPTVLDRVRRDAVEAALGPIEALVSQWPVSDDPRTEYRAAVSQCAKAVRTTLAAARDAAEVKDE